LAGGFAFRKIKIKTITLVIVTTVFEKAKSVKIAKTFAFAPIYFHLTARGMLLEILKVVFAN